MKPDKQGIVQLHGREYKTVGKRVSEFREAHPIGSGWAITTTIIENNEDRVICRAAISLQSEGSVQTVATGLAEERRTSRGINATSALENCETSAIGRALAAAGFGGTEYASAEEVTRAIEQQRQGENSRGGQHHPSFTDNERRAFMAALRDAGTTYPEVCEFTEARNYGRPSAWTTADRHMFVADLKAGRIKLNTEEAP